MKKVLPILGLGVMLLLLLPGVCGSTTDAQVQQQAVMEMPGPSALPGYQMADIYHPEGKQYLNDRFDDDDGLVMTTDKMAYAAGESVYMTITNVGDTVFYMGTPCGGPRFGAIFSNLRTDDVVFKVAPLKGAVGPCVIWTWLFPGESVVYEWETSTDLDNGRYRLSLGTGGVDWDATPNGLYHWGVVGEELIIIR